MEFASCSPAQRAKRKVFNALMVAAGIMLASTALAVRTDPSDAPPTSMPAKNAGASQSSRPVQEALTPAANAQSEAAAEPAGGATTSDDGARTFILHEPIQVCLAPKLVNWFDLDASITSFWEELPKLLIAALVGWFVAVRITNKWDLAKKRNDRGYPGPGVGR
jgi:hypothetical protein